MRIQRRETSLRRVDTCVHDERGCPQAADEDGDIQPVQGTEGDPAERMPGIILMPASVLAAIIAASQLSNVVYLYRIVYRLIDGWIEFVAFDAGFISIISSPHHSRTIALR